MKMREMSERGREKWGGEMEGRDRQTQTEKEERDREGVREGG